MSCCLQKRTLIVTYKGTSIEKAGGLNSYNQLLQWVYTGFPELRCSALTFKLNSSTLDASNFAQHFKSQKSLELTALPAKSKISTNLGVFKLRLDQDDLICTGFLITASFAVVPTETLNTYDILRLRIVFEDDNETGFKRGGEVLMLSNDLSAVEIETPCDSFQPIVLDTRSYIDYDTSYILYYHRRYPILQKQMLRNLNFQMDSLAIEPFFESGAVGSPVLAFDNKLVGVVVNLGFLDLITNFSSRITENLSIPQSVDQSSVREIPSFFPTTCCLDHSNDTGIYYSTEDAVSKVFQCEKLLPGSTAICTDYGIFIVGLAADQRSQVLLFDGKSLTELPRPFKKHLYHCCIYLDDRIYVISGCTTAVEYYNLTESTWSSVASLPKRRAMATAVSKKSSIYVIGGRREEKFIKSILRFASNEWEKIQVKLPIGLAMVGCVQRRHDWLVFGGEGAEGKNVKSWKVSEKGGQVSGEAFEMGGCFGRFPPLCLKDEVLMYTNDKVLIKYDTGYQELFTVSLDNEMH